MILLLLQEVRVQQEQLGAEPMPLVLELEEQLGHPMLELLEQRVHPMLELLEQPEHPMKEGIRHQQADCQESSQIDIRLCPIVERERIRVSIKREKDQLEGTHKSTKILKDGRNNIFPCQQVATFSNSHGW